MNNELKNEWEIWSEGYMATGEHGTATFEGKFKGKTFDEAVENYISFKEQTSWPDIRKFYTKKERYAIRDDTTGRMPIKVVHAIWACRLFDNEKEARESFG